jgi:hypothetical protein
VEFIHSLDLTLLWKFLNTGFITTLMGILIGSWATLRFVEGSKKRASKQLLLNVLYRELNHILNQN